MYSSMFPPLPGSNNWRSFETASPSACAPAPSHSASRWNSTTNPTAFWQSGRNSRWAAHGIAKWNMTKPCRIRRANAKGPGVVLGARWSEKLFWNLVGWAGFEPPNRWLGRDLRSKCREAFGLEPERKKAPYVTGLGRLKMYVFGCGGRIWTCDLQVMSLTSYQTAPPRDKFIFFYPCVVDIIF